MRKSIVDNRNLYSALHRFMFTHGWVAAASFFAVAAVSFAILPYPAIALLCIAGAIAALSGWTDFTEYGLRSLREAAKLREREEKNLSLEERFNRMREDLD